MVGHEIWQETLKNMQNETHTIGPGIWRETVKNVKYENAHCRTWNMARKLTGKENEKFTCQDMKHCEKD